MRPQYDALVIGGGFYGTAIAKYLKNRRGLDGVLLAERDEELLGRASYRNQARIHNGYHYPRSFTTAYRSRVNFPRFVKDYPEAVRTDFTKVYAIARNNSKITARQFERFCKNIGAPLAPAPKVLRALFNPRLIEDVFVVEEFAFDALALRRLAEVELTKSAVEVRTSTSVVALRVQGDGIAASLSHRTLGAEEISTRLVFNCTYSNLNQLEGKLPLARVRLKHEIAEIALVQAPEELAQLGITVMDGPFFSMMPFPPRGLHSLSHVRFTPHKNWADERGVDPYSELDRYDKISRFDRMLRDVSRFIPSAQACSYQDSLFEVKTLLAKNETDDGRPILFERPLEMPNCYSILGGKLDNIYDIIEKLDGERLSRP